MTNQPRPANRMLTALPYEEFERLRPKLREINFHIGETVYLAQRIEQLTKTHGGPILMSEQTHGRLRWSGSIPRTSAGIGCRRWSTSPAAKTRSDGRASGPR